jgi:MFS family permease
MLALLSVAELLGMSVWFAAAAVAPHFREIWGISVAEAGWLTTSVQLGFVAGTIVAAVLNLADVIPSRAYFAASALLAATANAALLLADGYGQALALRFSTGFFLAGVYPPGMKMAATWFRARRGLAIGTVVGALTVGKASPYLVDAIGGAGIGFAVWSTTASAALAALLIGVAYREGPFAFERRPFSWGLVGTVLRDRGWRLATAGYLGHMWELYAFWTWIVVFLSASAAAYAGTSWAGEYSSGAEIAAFMAIAIGGPACVWGGRVADRVGREKLAIGALTASGVCALLAGLAFGASPWLVTPLALAWGWFVIADSAQFSALVTELSPSHAVGTALTIQVAVGFLLTMVTIQLVPTIAETAGWRWAFPVLAAGPAFAIGAMRRLMRARAELSGPVPGSRP